MRRALPRTPASEAEQNGAQALRAAPIERGRHAEERLLARPLGREQPEARIAMANRPAMGKTKIRPAGRAATPLNIEISATRPNISPPLRAMRVDSSSSTRARIDTSNQPGKSLRRSPALEGAL